MKTKYHFIITLYILVYILYLIYLFTDCDDHIKVNNTGNKKIDIMPYWSCPDKSNKFSRISKFNKGDDSMGVLDKWSITHTTHGLIFFCIILFFHKHYFNNEYSNKFIYIALLFELIWEILENLPYIINKYRKSRNLYRDYVGDSIANAFSDMIFTLFGIIISYYLSIKDNKITSLKPLIFTILLFEIFTYFFIDDNIVINLYSLFIKK